MVDDHLHADLPHNRGLTNDPCIERVKYPCRPCLQLTTRSLDENVPRTTWPKIVEVLTEIFRKVRMESTGEPFAVRISDTHIEQDGISTDVLDLCVHGVGVWMCADDAERTLNHIAEVAPHYLFTIDENATWPSTRVGIPRFRYVPAMVGDISDMEGVRVEPRGSKRVEDSSLWSCAPGVDVEPANRFPQLTSERDPLSKPSRSITAPPVNKKPRLTETPRSNDAIAAAAATHAAPRGPPPPEIAARIEQVRRGVNALLRASLSEESTLPAGCCVPRLEAAHDASFFTGYTKEWRACCFRPGAGHRPRDMAWKSCWCTVRRDGTVTYGCNHPSCRGKRAVLGKLDEAVWPTGRTADLQRAADTAVIAARRAGDDPLQPFAEHTEWFEETKIVSQRYLDTLDASVEPANRPLDPHTGRVKQLVMVGRSAMGTGKTTLFKDLLSRRDESGAYAFRCVLLVSSRIQYSKTAMGLLESLGFKVYLDNDIKPFTEHERCIFQYESMHKIGPLAKPIDLLIIDEAESVAQCSTSPTNKGNVLPNARVFETIGKYAGMTLALDADMGVRAVEMIKCIANPNAATKLLVNRWKPRARDVVLYAAYNNWLGQIRRALSERKRLVIVTSSRDLIEKDVVEGMLRKEFGFRALGEGEAAPAEAGAPPQRTFRFYHSGGGKEQMDDFCDINAVWSQLDVVVYTPRVTVGADCTLKKHFDEVFVYGTPHSVCARVLWQMIGRTRDPKETTIHAFLKESRCRPPRSAPHAPPLTLEGVRKAINTRLRGIEDVTREVLEEEAETGAYEKWRSTVEEHVLTALHEQGLGKDGKIRYAHMYPWLRRNYEHTQLEANQTLLDLDNQFVQGALHRGHTVRVVAPTPEDESEMRTMSRPEYRRRRAMVEYERVAPAIEAVKDRRGELARLNVRVMGGQATTEERTKRDVLRHLVAFKNDPAIPINARHYACAAPELRLARNVRLTLDGVGSVDLMQRERSRWKDRVIVWDFPGEPMATIDLSQDRPLELRQTPHVVDCHLVHRVCSALGLEGPLDTETTLSDADLAGAVKPLGDVARLLINVHPALASPHRIAALASGSGESGTVAEAGRLVKDMANSVFRRWHGGQLRPAGKEKRVKRGESSEAAPDTGSSNQSERQRNYEYRLEFKVINKRLFPHTVLEVASDLYAKPDAQQENAKDPKEEKPIPPPETSGMRCEEQ